MLKRFTIIYPPVISWQEVIFQRPQQLLSEFARLGHLAIFANRISDGKGIYWFAEDNLCIANDLLPTLADPVLKKQMQGTRVVFWISYPGLMWLKTAVKPDITVFDYIDQGVEEFNWWQSGLKEAMDVADLITVSSQKLWELTQANYPDKTVLIRNGADIRNFKQNIKGIPADLNRIRKKHSSIIGFHGTLQSWLDYQLIRDMALARPQWGIVLLGLEGCAELALCKDVPNIYFVGGRHYQQLPFYVKNFDVGIIPFQVRELTHSSNPIKMYEYLATGVPVVATPIWECENLAPVVRIGRNSAEFISQIEAALRAKPNEVAAYVKLAHENSWTERVKKALAVLEGIK